MVNNLHQYFIERERLAAIERELANKPVKPEYTDEELQSLITCIMEMTTLYDLRPEDWKDDVKAGIEDWLMEPKALILTIYFKGERLKASSDMPISPVYDLTYFIRTPDHIFNPETFHEEVTFGTFVESVEANMIDILEMVYAPFFFSINTWPDSKFLYHNIFE